MNDFVQELLRRRVHRLLMAYIAGSWMLLEATDLIAPMIGLPDWSTRLVLTLISIGFPVAIALSWIYDFTSEGIIRTDGTSPISISQLAPLVIISVLVALVAFLYVRPDPEVQLNELRPSIGVLPFVNMSGDRNNEYFSDGISEEILNRLANVDGLQVAARTSSFYFKNKNMSVEDIARTLDVSVVLEGSVRKSENRVRITAQLIDGKSGYHLFSKSYDEELKDIFAVQDRLAREVVSAIRPVLLPGLDLQPETQTSSIDAYNAFLKGQAALNERLTVENLDIAAGHFADAINLDQTFANAYAGQCQVMLRRYVRLDEVDAFEHAEKSCHRALTRSSNPRGSWQVHHSLAELYRVAGQGAQALEEIEQAIRLKDDAPQLWIEKALIHISQHSFDLGETVLRETVEMAPSYWDAYLVLANFYYDQHRYEEAIKSYKSVLHLVPGYVPALIGLGSALYMSGEEESAAAIWLSVEELVEPKDFGSLGRAYSNLGLLYYYRGDYEKSVELQLKAGRYRPKDHEPLGRLAESYRALGSRSEEKESYKSAVRLARDQLAVNPDDWTTLGLLGIYEAFLGDEQSALQRVEVMLDLKPDDPFARYYAALVSYALNDVEQVFLHLENGKANGLENRYILDDPDLFQLSISHADRFRQLLSD